MPFVLYFFVGVAIRVWRAGALIVGLVLHRDRSRALPWPYIRRHVRSDPVCIAAIISIVCTTVLWPFVVSLEDSSLQPWLMVLLMAAWAVCAIVMGYPGYKARRA